MRRIGLIFGTYNLLPQGENADVFEQVYQNALRPFLSLLNNYPRFPVVLHYCGSLYLWLEESHPEFIMLLKEMTRRKQVELLSGGFYAPMLPILPDGDKIGQIEKLTTYLRTTFGGRPRGAWIPERVWEPGLTRILANSGIEYTFLDDRHLTIAGLDEKDRLNPYLTEEQGKTVTILPLVTSLARMVPQHSPEAVVLQLHELAQDEDYRLAALMLPCTRPGGLEGEEAAIYGKNGQGGWVNSFLQVVEKNREWIQPVTPRWNPEVMRPRGRVYLPCLASEEVMRGVLSPERQKAFNDLSKRIRRQEVDQYIPGGFFRMFLTKYPEVDQLYCRFMHARLQVGQIRGDKYRKRAALDELWKGQTGAIYWHGSREGAYANHLRKAAYRSFIEAERIARGALEPTTGIIETDFDLDGRAEYLYQGKRINAFVHACGGALFELDYLPAAWNYLDTFARWPESYHKYKYEGCDWYPRRAFIDHFLPPDADVERFDRMTLGELGDFVKGAYELGELRRDHRELVLERQGTVREKKKRVPLRVTKRFRFRDDGVELQVRLGNTGNAALTLNYALELNLSPPEGAELSALAGGEPRTLEGGRCEHTGIEGVRVRDPLNRAGLALSAASPFALWCMPVETVTYLPSGRCRSYQGSCFVLRWPYELEPGGTGELSVSLKLSGLTA
jgi:hypothetical protein